MIDHEEEVAILGVAIIEFIAGDSSDLAKSISYRESGDELMPYEPDRQEYTMLAIRRKKVADGATTYSYDILTVMVELLAGGGSG